MYYRFVVWYAALKLFLDNGADVNTQGGGTLFLAPWHPSIASCNTAEAYQSRAMLLLLGKGANTCIHVQGENYGSALQYAAHDGILKLFKSF